MNAEEAFFKWCADEMIVPPRIDYISSGGTELRLDGYFSPRALRLLARWLECGAPNLEKVEV